MAKRHSALSAFSTLAALAAAFCLTPAVAGADDATGATASERLVELTYAVKIDGIPKGRKGVDVFVPLALETPEQSIRSMNIKASIPGEQRTDELYGNRFWHGHLEVSDGEPVEVTVRYRVLRRRVEVNTIDVNAEGDELPASTKRHLQADQRVPTSGELVERVLQDVPEPASPTRLGWSRAIYDYVVDTMEYKKVGTGWGNGDTHWACSKRYGNCTDFHALFTSLARAKDIPARFEIGLPIPVDRKKATIGGYHCWVRFYTPETGWFPIDASEAKKHPDQRVLLFGTQPPDRVLFTRGRDLELGKGHTTGPLNYFIYPHVEVGGKQLPDEKIKTIFRFEEVSSPSKTRAAVGH